MDNDKIAELLEEIKSKISALEEELNLGEDEDFEEEEEEDEEDESDATIPPVE